MFFPFDIRFRCREMNCMNALFTQSWCSFKMIFNGRRQIAHTYTDAKCSNTQILTWKLAPSLVCIFMQWLFAPFFIPLQHSFRTTCICVCSGVFSFSLLLSFFAAAATIRTYFAAEWKYQIRCQCHGEYVQCSVCCYLRVTNFEYPKWWAICFLIFWNWENESFISLIWKRRIKIYSIKMMRQNRRAMYFLYLFTFYCVYIFIFMFVSFLCLC